MTAIDRILQSYRDAAGTEREKGTYFERLALVFFMNDPVQSEEYEAVWTWSDWAKTNGRDGKDVGIDLVAKLRNEAGFAAIQAKFYAADARIQKVHIDSFISASGKEPFSRRVVLDTTEKEWGINAEEMIRDQAIPVVRIGLTDLRESRIDWTIFEARGEIVLSAKKSLLDHQKDALADVSKGLAAADRGKMIMACGTGKTFTSLKIAEAIAGKGKRVLFMVPSLALMSQTVREWTNDTETPIRAFAVCSDAHVGKRRKSTDDIAEIEIHDLAFPATTDPVKVAEKAGEDDPERMTVIFSTYQSIATLTRAQEAGLPEFDLIIGSSSICVSRSDRVSQIEGIRPWYRRSIGLQPPASRLVRSASLRRVHGSYLADWLRMAPALSAGRPQDNDMVGGAGGSRIFLLRAKRFGSSSGFVDGDV